MSRADLFVGLISGTSADAVDAALVAFDPAPHVIHATTTPLSQALRGELRGVTSSTPLRDVARLDVQIGRLFAEAALGLLAAAGVPADRIRAIGSHGQTLWHEPGGDFPYTLQIGDPNIIAERTGITTVADFRRRDIAAGGQGAPLVPAFHAEVFGSDDEDRCVLNLGGIANVSLLPRGRRVVAGYDTGPANTLMDAWIHRHRRLPYDADGAWARSGSSVPELLARMLAEPYFRLPAPKSTGRELFSLEWLDACIGEDRLRPEDVQATLAALTARSVAEAIRKDLPEVRQLLVCGGGARNGHLMELLQTELPKAKVTSTQALGIDPDYVEACAFAWLARQTLLGLPGNLTSVTGASRPVVLGGIYAGRAS